MIDLGGRTLMPGLIDAHVHVTAVGVDLGALQRMPVSLITAKAGRILEGMLLRGFTTVRDAGGADHGLAEAVRLGLFRGPRLLVSGRAMSQTGGHGDFRPQVDLPVDPCGCAHLHGGIGRIADGVPDVRRAARDEIRLGAKQIKIMASGGVASPTDPIHFTQYAMEELRALVEEAEAAGTYAFAHAYTPKAIRRAIAAGCRSIEHGNLLDEPTARLMAERGVYLVPTLATYHALAAYGRELGFPEVSLRKLDDVIEAGTEALRIAKAAGVRMAYGTDLLGDLHRHQLSEFRLRGGVLGPAELIRSATVVCAELMNMDGRIGVIEPGALADLLVVDGDPLATGIDLLAELDRHLVAVMKGGVFVRNDVEAATAASKATLGPWFEQRKRTRKCEMFLYQEDAEIRILITHGGLFRADGNITDRLELSRLPWRPQKHDSIIYDTKTGVLKVHAQFEVERQVYRETLGRALEPVSKLRLDGLIGG